MKLAYVCCFLLITVWQEVDASGSGPSGVLDRVSGSSSCSQLRLKPAGQCEDEEECPYQIQIPPLTIQLPKQFRLLEKTMKELQSLKETVNRLKSSCLECSSQQVDLNLQKDSGDPPTNAEESRGDTSKRVYQNCSRHCRAGFDDMTAGCSSCESASGAIAEMGVKPSSSSSSSSSSDGVELRPSS